MAKDDNGAPQHHPQLRTDEHLICTPVGRRNKVRKPSKRGVDPDNSGTKGVNKVRVTTRYLTHHPHNIRRCCHRCNSFVGDWHIELKIKFGVWIRHVGGWEGVYKVYPVKEGRKRSVVEMLNRSTLALSTTVGE